MLVPVMHGLRLKTVMFQLVVTSRAFRDSLLISTTAAFSKRDLCRALSTPGVDEQSESEALIKYSGACDLAVSRCDSVATQLRYAT